MVHITPSALIKANRFIRSNSLKFLGVYLANLLDFRHTILRLDPIKACNLRCQMCYFSDEKWRKENTGIFSEEEIKRIAQEFFPRALQLYIGCGMEPTIYKNFVDIVRLASKYRIPFVSMISNGQLITEEHLYELIYYGLDELTLSTHGVTKETYERLMVNAKYERFTKLLGTLIACKSKKNSPTPKLRLNYTVNPDNLAELRQFFDVYGDYNIDTLQVRPIMNWGDVAYQQKDLSPWMIEYNEILDELTRECKRRKVTLIYNRWDPTYSAPNEFAPVYTEGVLRFIRPGRVWSEDYRFMDESYRSFSKRSGYRRKMLRYGLGIDPVSIKSGDMASWEIQ